MADNGNNDGAQFASLIAAIAQLGGLPPTLLNAVCERLDLQERDVTELLERATKVWHSEAAPALTPEQVAYGQKVAERIAAEAGEPKVQMTRAQWDALQRLRNLLFLAAEQLPEGGLRHAIVQTLLDTD